jgi:hypothetical protein
VDSLDDFAGSQITGARSPLQIFRPPKQLVRLCFCRAVAVPNFMGAVREIELKPDLEDRSAALIVWVNSSHNSLFMKMTFLLKSV